MGANTDTKTSIFPRELDHEAKEEIQGRVPDGVGLHATCAAWIRTLVRLPAGEEVGKLEPCFHSTCEPSHTSDRLACRRSTLEPSTGPGPVPICQKRAARPGAFRTTLACGSPISLTNASASMAFEVSRSLLTLELAVLLVGRMILFKVSSL